MLKSEVNNILSVRNELFRKHFLPDDLTYNDQNRRTNIPLEDADVKHSAYQKENNDRIWVIFSEDIKKTATFFLL